MTKFSSPEAIAAPERSIFETEIIAGLSKPQKSIPCQYFYDAAGSALFEKITVLQEYYPTRTEIAILHACVAEIAARTPMGSVLVEFGSGSSTKTDILLAACPAITRYVPIDVSPTALSEAKTRLKSQFPLLSVEPILGDFAAGVALPGDIQGLPKLGFFPGSTIGNFTDDQAIALLSRFRALLGQSSRLIVGADLRKSANVLVAAYDDSDGVTAAFNLNLLARINRELAGTFNLSKFQHLATYDIEAGRIDMFLVSMADQTITVAGTPFQFVKGEKIHTEISQKYTVDAMQDLGRRAGWQVAAVWTDPAQLFSVHEFTVPNEAP